MSRRRPFKRSTDKSAKPLLEKWQTWVALLVGVLTAFTLAIDLPEKIGLSSAKPVAPEKEGELLEQVLSGSIRDEANDPLPGVEVSLPKFRLTATTDGLGHFQFLVTAPKQDSVEVMAQKKGYETYEAYATLGNTSLGFTLRRRR